MCPFFIYRGTMAKVGLDLEKIIAPAVEAVGLEYWGLEWFPRANRSLLRVYVDTSVGVTIDECGRASAQISAVLDVEEPISGRYDLEVSSPGFDRPLFKLEQYVRYVGEVIKIKLRADLEGRRNFKGKLVAVSDGKVSMDIDGEPLEVPFSEIEKANVVTS